MARNEPMALPLAYGNMAWRALGLGVSDRNVLLAGIYLSPDPADWRELVANIDVWSNEWIHLAFITGSAGQRLFLNGVLMKTNSLNGSFAASPKGSLHFLGRAPGGEELRGQIDEFRVWDVGRTEWQIRENMIKRMVGNEPGLVGLWNFDDPANPGKDASPGAHHGKLIGQATVTNAAPPASRVREHHGRRRQTAGERECRNHQPGQPDRRVTANAAGEYAHDFFRCPATCSSRMANCPPTASVSNPPPSRSSASTGRWPTRRRRRWCWDRYLGGPSCHEAQSTNGAVDISGPRVTRPSEITRPSESGKVLTNFPAGTVVATMLTDDQGNFRFANVKPALYQLRAQVPGGRAWLNGGRILYANPEAPDADRARLANLDFRLAPFTKGIGDGSACRTDCRAPRCFG
jgi:hypothetical protein